MRIWLCSIALMGALPLTVCGQADSLPRPLITWSLYTDLYIGARVPSGADHHLAPFLYNFNRTGTLAVNLALARVGLTHRRIRANVAVHAGTYVNDNYASEPEWLRPFSEVSVGAALDRKKRMWLDAGIIPSHIGFESAVGMDNANLTRSLLAENSPYYLAGARLTWRPDTVWEVAALVCNGWQRIRPVPGNTLPGFGTQLVVRPRTGMALNWSTFIGTDDPDSTRRVRFFNNLYGLLALGPKWSLTAGFDVGMQQHSKGSGAMDVWLSPVLIARWTPLWRLALAARAEYYRDGQGVIVADGPRWGGGIVGASVNVDLWLTRHLALRTEGRWLGGTQAGAPQVFTLVAMLALKVGG